MEVTLSPFTSVASLKYTPPVTSLPVLPACSHYIRIPVPGMNEGVLGNYCKETHHPGEPLGALHGGDISTIAQLFKQRRKERVREVIWIKLKGNIQTSRGGGNNTLLVSKGLKGKL